MINFQFSVAKKHKVKKSNYHPTSTTLPEKWLAVNVVDIKFFPASISHTSIITPGYTTYCRM